MSDDGSSLEVQQNSLLRRYASQIRRAAEYAVRIVPGVERDDALQEARFLLLSYAGLLSSPSRHFGTLSHIEETARDAPAVVISQLKEDLVQMFSRAAEPQHSVFDEEDDPRMTPGDKKGHHISKMDLQREMPRLTNEYPTIIAMVFQGRTEVEIAEERGITHQAVSAQLARERKRAADDSFFWPLDKDGVPVKPKVPAGTREELGKAA